MLFNKATLKAAVLVWRSKRPEFHLLSQAD
jgi:hypothetical protein